MNPWAQQSKQAPRNSRRVSTAGWESPLSPPSHRSSRPERHAGDNCGRLSRSSPSLSVLLGAVCYSDLNSSSVDGGNCGLLGPRPRARADAARSASSEPTRWPNHVGERRHTDARNLIHRYSSESSRLCGRSSGAPRGDLRTLIAPKEPYGRGSGACVSGGREACVY